MQFALIMTKDNQEESLKLHLIPGVVDNYFLLKLLNGIIMISIKFNSPTLNYFIIDSWKAT